MHSYSAPPSRNPHRAAPAPAPAAPARPAPAPTPAAGDCRVKPGKIGA